MRLDLVVVLGQVGNLVDVFVVVAAVVIGGREDIVIVRIGNGSKGSFVAVILGFEHHSLILLPPLKLRFLWTKLLQR